MVPDEVMPDLNVLCLIVLNRIMRNLDVTPIVTQEWNLVTMNSIVLQRLPHPKELSTTTRHGHILGFGGGDLPRNWQAPEDDFLSTLSPTQSESEYPTISKLDPFGYQRPKVGV
jgi:hypothetical protein